MIKGIGIDIIELSRVRSLVGRQPKFIERVLTEVERQRYYQLSLARGIEFLAGRFAVKEAFAKAAGSGIGKQLSFLDIEIANDRLGKPFIAKPEVRAHISISHSREYAIAQVIIEEE
ncbi:holo-ACP synthase [Bacillus rubiinfantis]|uniref:holo-ACP synthase n=1 Tax=Bacillus rubiinfantis TaxID=1499680 RepID=UPI0005AA48EE|nr:holo-ACP synthase [Bacillus rubiinfantis]